MQIATVSLRAVRITLERCNKKNPQGVFLAALRPWARFQSPSLKGKK